MGLPLAQRLSFLPALSPSPYLEAIFFHRSRTKGFGFPCMLGVGAEGSCRARLHSIGAWMVGQVLLSLSLPSYIVIV